MSEVEDLLRRAKKEWNASKSYLTLQYQMWRNRCAKKSGKPEPFAISAFDRIRQPKPAWVGAARRSRMRFNDLPATVQAALIAFVFVLCILVFWGAPFDWGGVTTELWGLLAEILVLGVVIFYIGEKSQTSQFVARQHELISDFKYWDSDEAKFRILGSIRRLNQHRVSKVELSGVRIKAANLKEHGITSLDSSTLSGGHWASSIGIRTHSTFESVDFSDCSLQNVKFSFGDGMEGLTSRDFQHPEATYLNCSFNDCDMSNSSFEQAELKWESAPPQETHEHVADDDETGQPIYNRCHVGPFYQANLKEVSFKNAWFENCDFRDAENILTCSFFGAMGLESCVFDNDEIKEQIISKSKVPQ